MTPKMLNRGGAVILQKRSGMFIGLIITILGFSVISQESQAFLGLDLDNILFKYSLKTATYSVRLACKSLMKYPKMIAVILSIYFYKEILGIAKNKVGQIVGEFPEISCIAGLCVLFYASTYLDADEGRSAEG